MIPLFLLTLAYRPFLEPLPLHAHWPWLLLPLSFIIALVYKTLKLHPLQKLFVESLRLTVLIILFMAVAAVGLWLLTELI